MELPIRQIIAICFLVYVSWRLHDGARRGGRSKWLAIGGFVLALIVYFVSAMVLPLGYVAYFVLAEVELKGEHSARMPMLVASGILIGFATSVGFVGWYAERLARPQKSAADESTAPEPTAGSGVGADAEGPG